MSSAGKKEKEKDEKVGTEGRTLTLFFLRSNNSFTLAAATQNGADALAFMRLSDREKTMWKLKQLMAAHGLTYKAMGRPSVEGHKQFLEKHNIEVDMDNLPKLEGEWLVRKNKKSPSSNLLYDWLIHSRSYDNRLLPSTRPMASTSLCPHPSPRREMAEAPTRRSACSRARAAR